MVAALQDLSGAPLYHAAVSVGLAIQACYLTKTTEKEASLTTVIRSLVRANEEFLKVVDSVTEKYPLNTFMQYYLFGRDSVASTVIKAVTEKMIGESGGSEEDKAQEDATLFWCIVGLIEAGYLEESEKLIRHYDPSEARFLLALDLGCFLISNLRISSEAERKIANRICHRLTPKVNGLRKQVVAELKSLLLEVRHDRIKAIDVASVECNPSDESEEGD